MIATAVDALGIFSAGEFDGAGRVGEKHFIARGSKLVLDDDGLAADHVGGTVKQERGGDAAGEGAIDGLVLVIEGIFHHHVRRDWAGRFVDVLVERDVRVAVDDAGCKVFSSGIDDGGVGGGADGGAYGGDFAVLDVDGAVLDVAVGDGHHGGVLD